MANTSSRMLRLLSLLQTRRYWPGADLAARLDVSARTLRRDIERLRELGYPVDAQRGVDGGYELAAGAALPPLVLDDDEAVALSVGLQAAIQGGTVVGIAEAAVRALGKVAQVMPPRLRNQVDAFASMTQSATWGDRGPAVDPQLLTASARACRDLERLEFTYTARDGEHTSRVVEPHRLVLLGRRWYLVAWDLTRYDWRSFRVDRVSELSSTGAHFATRQLPAGDAADFVRASIDNLPTQYRVEAIVHAQAEIVHAQLGRWGSVEDIGDNRCMLHMTTDSLDWPMMALGSTAADFEVLGPPELLDQVQDWARRFIQAAGAAAPSPRNDHH